MSEKTERPPGHRRRLWPLIFLFSLALVSLLLRVERSRRVREVRRTGERHAVQVAARPIAKVKAARAVFYETRYFLGYPMSVSFAVADLLRRIDGIRAPLQLLDARVDPGLNGLEFALTVKVAAASTPAARRIFTVFFSRLEMLPGVVEASFLMSDRAGDGAQVFIVNGQAEWL